MDHLPSNSVLELLFVHPSEKILSHYYTFCTFITSEWTLYINIEIPNPYMIYIKLQSFHHRSELQWWKNERNLDSGKRQFCAGSNLQPLQPICSMTEMRFQWQFIYHNAINIFIKNWVANYQGFWIWNYDLILKPIPIDALQWSGGLQWWYVHRILRP